MVKFTVFSWLLLALVGLGPLQLLGHWLERRGRAGLSFGVQWFEATLLAGGPGVFGSAVFTELILTSRPGWGSFVWGGLVGGFFALLQARVCAPKWRVRWFWATWVGWTLACGVCVNLFLRLGNPALGWLPLVGALCVSGAQAWAAHASIRANNNVRWWLWNTLALGGSLALGIHIGVAKFTGQPLLPWAATLVFGGLYGLTTGVGWWQAAPPAAAQKGV